MHTLTSVYITNQDDSPQYTMNSSDSVNRQDPIPQPEASMFGSSDITDVKQSSKPKRRTFEDIREENRRRMQQQQQQQTIELRSPTDKTGIFKEKMLLLE